MKLLEFGPKTEPQPMAPVVVFPGIFSIKQTKHLYAGILGGRATAYLPAEERFIPAKGGGTSDRLEIEEEAEDRFLKAYDKLETRVVGVGHSLGGLILSKIARKHPEAFSSVILVAGLQEGIKDETLAVRGLKYLIERYTGGKSEYEHALSDSMYMRRHVKDISEQWSPDVSVDLISPTWDPLFPHPQGLNLKLPPGQQTQPFVVGMNTEQARSIAGVPEHTIGMPSWLKVGHVGVVMHPAVQNHIREKRITANEPNALDTANLYPLAA